MTDRVESPEITEDQVKDFLLQHQDFFVRNDQLLENIELPHSRGEAVSLVERQVSLLRERNIEMRNRLTGLLENARENDRLFDKTKKLVLSLLEAKDLKSCCDSLIDSFANDFDIHYTSLIIYGNQQQWDAGGAQIASMEEVNRGAGHLLRRGNALCGQFEKGELETLFPEFSKSVASAAIAPLVSAGPIGVLAIGNRDPDYYRSSMGTLFLSYIAEVLNRVLPTHMNG